MLVHVIWSSMNVMFLLQKPGKWCAVHVRIAWEIYLFQQKQSGGDKLGGPDSKSMPDPLRPPSHLLPGGSLSRPPEMQLTIPTSLFASGRSMFDSSPHGLSTPGSHLCKYENCKVEVDVKGFYLLL